MVSKIEAVKKLRHERWLADKCIDCSAPNISSYLRCTRCRAKLANYMKLRYFKKVTTACLK